MRRDYSQLKSGLKRFIVHFVGAVLVIVVCLMVGKHLGLGPTDDAFITYRYAQNFAHGFGLVYNVGEPVEATSSFLFALLLGILAAFRFEPILGAVLIGLLSLGSISFLLIRDAAGRLRDSPARSWHWFTGLALLICCPATIYYVWVGLETIFHTALFFIGCLLFVGRSGSVAQLGLAGLFIGLAACTRMESVIFMPVAIAALLLGRGLKATLKGGGAASFGFLLVFLPVLLLRWRVYGFPFPNTYYVKVHGGTFDLWIRGLHYLEGFASVYLGLVIVAMVAVLRFIGAKKDRFRTGFLLLAILTQAVYVAYVGGDFFPFCRFMVPVLPLFALLFADVCAFGISRSGEVEGTGNTAHRAAVPFLATLVFAGATFCVSLLYPEHYAMADSQQKAAVKRAQVGRLLRRNVPRDATLLLGAAGAIPYYSRLETHDVFGLTDPVVAHKKMALGRGKPGHEKIDAENQIARLEPDLILCSSWPNAGTLRRTSIRRQVRFYFSIQEFGLKAKYVPMRLANLDVTAVIAVRRDFLHELGRLFTRIGLPRVRALGEPHLGRSIGKLDHLQFHAASELVLTGPASQGLPLEIASRGARWQRYPPLSELAAIWGGVECHIRGMRELSCLCTHLFAPFSVHASLGPETPPQRRQSRKWSTPMLLSIDEQHDDSQYPGDASVDSGGDIFE